mmetsp:Transcript_21678/g.26934  ORF Transcript_21678/g.26934 Transcript_21678/m.26934 type:complete len:1290 (-) Transcript_21678:225-4094(-)
MVFPGESITLTITITGDLIVDDDATFNLITIFLCKGDVSVNDSEICQTEDTGFIEIVVLGRDVTDPSAGSFTYSMPEGIDSGSDYYFTVLYYLSANRRILMNEAADPGNADALFFTDAFSVAPYAPTLAPSYNPTVAPTPRPTPKISPSPTKRPTNSPTRSPTRSPTLSFEPTYIPTELPTTCGIIIREVPDIWLQDETIQIRLDICTDKPNRGSDDSVLDILLYEGDSEDQIRADSATPVAIIAEREKVDSEDESLLISYGVPSTLTESSEYRIRVVEYGNGYSSISNSFSILSVYPPTVAPTPSGLSVIAVSGGETLKYNQNDYLLNPGDFVRLTVVYYGTTWPFEDDTIEVSIRLCVDSCADDESIVESLIYSADISNTGSFVSDSQGVFLSFSLESRLDYRFFMEIQETGDTFTTGTFPIGVDATATPSYRPTTVEPSRFPTLSPTKFDIRFSFDDGTFWINGRTISITVTIDENVDVDVGILDLLLYNDNFVFGDEPVETIASYVAVDLEGSTSFEYAVDVPSGNYRVRAIEYVLGFDVTSTVITVATDFPTYLPTPAPSEANPVRAIEVSTGNILEFGVGEFLVAGNTYLVSPWDASTEVSISICSLERIKNGVCTSVLVTLAFATTDAVTFIPAVTLVDQGELVFQTLSPGGTAFISGSFFVVGYEPTRSPTVLDTTSRPSISEPLVFRPAFESTWVLGRSVTITVLAQSSGVLDILIYEAPAPGSAEYDEPVDAIAIYKEINAGFNVFEYDVEFLTPGTYQLRAIDYDVGAEAYSGFIFVVLSDTYSPTLSPTEKAADITLTVTISGGFELEYDAGDSLIAGIEYSAQLRTSLDQASINSVTVSICASSDIGENGRCRSIAQSVAFAVPLSNVFTFEPLPSLVDRGDLVFQLWATTSTESIIVLTGTFQVESLPPTPSPSVTFDGPTYSPSHFPTIFPSYVPTTSGLQIQIDDLVWKQGSTQSVHLLLTGLSTNNLEDPTYVDVYLYEASDETRSPVLPIFASGAEMTDGILDLIVQVPTSIFGMYRIRAIEYTFGYVSESSDIITISDSAAPSVAPSPHPTPSPSVEPSTGIPTYAPTTSGLYASATINNEPLGTSVEPGTSVLLAFQYTGELVRASGTLTLRLCEDNRDNAIAYNGPAFVIPYTTCETNTEIVIGQPFERQLTVFFEVPTETSDTLRMYFRADAILDRDGLYTTWAGENTYVLAYQSDPFYIVHAPTSVPTPLSDSTSWFKRGDPSKDCSWVQSFTLDDGQRPRCGARGDDGLPGYEACLLSCIDYIPT